MIKQRWHPDRCSAPGNSKFVEEAKKKFQDIQQAYSVLSDANKRFLYDVGAYDSEDDDENNGMGEFLDEMAMMMSQTKPNENGKESFEELQNLFDEMFQGDLGSFGSGPQPATSCSTSCSASSYVSYCESSGSNNKRNSSEMNYEKATLEDFSGFDTHFQSFCFGVESRQDIGKGTAARERIQGEAIGKRRHGRKQKVTSGHDVSSNDYSGISAR
ncbi:dnaJ homolog subfamily B member 7-like isoform X3 [Prunus avium]|uniref:DnaJ homolog subfamily B member 7-like isoform X3 n=1 Tax=Prunus avium TaxID=42229 RepID=A0A6P5T8Q9_PRUAV|nr:dnaJ homolog subfamily B member 7-like isoform X3 [Prunus avium]